MNKNLILIRFVGALSKWKRRLRRGQAPLSFLENIDHFKTASPKTKRALISIWPVGAWFTALQQYPNIRLFNSDGLVYSLVKVLNEHGFVVDIVDRLDAAFRPAKHYDLFIGHGGRQSALIDVLEKEHTLILQYISQAYWKELLRQTNERYDDLCRRKGIPRMTSSPFARAHTEEEKLGEEYLAEHAKYFITGDYPRTMQGYGKYSPKMRPVGWAAYVEEDLIIRDRDCDAGRKGFIYVAGNLGNVQKGLDLLLDTFARTPDLNLYIYCNVEKEVRRLFRKELSLPNIRYIYHYKFGFLRNRLRAVLRRVNFTITAPINSGIGTAFLGSTGVGLIPVGYVDMPCSPSHSRLADSWHVESLVKNVREASQMPIEWCQKASALNMRNCRENWSAQSFERRFSAFMRECQA